MQGLGSTDAFNCIEMDMVVSEVQRVKEWKRRGEAIIRIQVGDDNMLLDGLSQVQCSSVFCSVCFQHSPDKQLPRDPCTS